LIAGIAELGVMMMTTVLVTIIMLLIWQVNIVIVLCFLTLFLGLELFFFSSVLGSAADGSWVLLVFAAVLYLVMYIWNYGSKLKYETEVKQKLSMDLLVQLGCNLGTVRAPGIGLLYNELVRGVPAIFGHFLTTLPAMHSMIIFVCIKWVPVPVVPQNERFLFRRVCPKNYHMFRCIARYELHLSEFLKISVLYLPPKLMLFGLGVSCMPIGTLRQLCIYKCLIL
jgi:K+ transporter